MFYFILIESVRFFQQYDELVKNGWVDVVSGHNEAAL